MGVGGRCGVGCVWGGGEVGVGGCEPEHGSGEPRMGHGGRRSAELLIHSPVTILYWPIK